MKNIKLLVLILLLAVVFCGFLQAAEVETFTVNGLKVIFKPNTSNDIIAANIYFPGGTTVLSNDQAGIENFALVVAQKATQNYPKDKLNAELERMNTRIFANTNLDYSSLNMQCVKQNFEKSWDIFADMLLNPSFEESDVELERTRLISGVKQQKDNPDAYLGQLVLESFFAEHPYSIAVNGTESSLANFSAAQLKEHLRNRVQTSQMLLVVVGNTSRKKIEKMVNKSFGKLPEGSYTAQMPPEVSHQEASLKIVQRDLPTNYIQGTFSAPGFSSPESYAMRIAGSILRDRLFKEVRTKRGLSYAPSAGYRGNFCGYGYVYVTAVDPDTTIRVITEELQKMMEEPVGEKELQNKVNVFVTRYYMQNETNQAQANILARYQLSGLGLAAADEFIPRLRQLTPADLQAVCQKYFKNLQFVLLGNPAQLKTGRFYF